MKKRHQRTLRRRVLRTIWLPVLLLIVSLISLIMVRGEQMIRQGSIDRGLAIVSFLAPAAEYGLIIGNEKQLAVLLDAVMAQPGVVAAQVQDSSGELVLARGQHVFDRELPAGVPLQAQLLSEQGQFKRFIAPVLSPLLEVDELAAPSRQAEALPLGWVQVDSDSVQHLRNLQRVAVTSAVIAALVLGLTAILALRLAQQVSRPLEELGEAVARIGDGEREVQVVSVAASRELFSLQQGFNQMAQALDQVHAEMQARIDEATRLLAHQASHDVLTGLPNRRAFDAALEELLSAMHRANDHAVLCIIDLDGFKAVNDGAGHAGGDALLCQVVELIRRQLRADDLLCRIGGDEFALVLRACSNTDAQRIAGQLCRVVAEYDFVYRHQLFKLGLSIGFAVINADTLSAAEVTHQADQACYAVKRAGRGFARQYDESMKMSGHAGDGND